MYKRIKNIVILIILIMIWVGIYLYNKNTSSLDISIKEQLVVKLYKDDSKYIINLNKFNWNKYQLNQENSKYNWNYIDISSNIWNDKTYSQDMNKYFFNWKIYKNGNLFIDYSKLWTLIEYFSLDSKYFITYKPFDIKCYDCNYFYIYNLDNKKSIKFSLYWENWEILIIENILWYVLN